MPDIDSLSIEIKSSSQPAITAIDKIIEALGRLNTALNKYSDGSDYAKGMNGLVKGLTGISSAVDSIDIEKLTTLTSKLGSLATAGEKLAKLNFAKSFSEMGSELQRANSAAANTSRRISELYSVPSKYRSDITDAVKRLYASTGKTAFNKAADDIRLMVKEAQNSKRELNDVYRNVRGYLNKTKIHIPDSVMQSWGDSANANRGKIGIANTTTKSGAGISIEIAAKEMRDAYGASIDLDHGLQACADSLIRFLDEEKYLEEIPTDFSMLGEILDSIYNKIFGIAEAYNTVAKSAKNADEEMLEWTGSADFDDIIDDCNRATNSVQNLDNIVEAVKSELQFEVANPFEGLITGLQSLEGVNVPAENFAGIVTLSSTLGKFGGTNAQRAIQVIPQVGRAFAQMAAELAKAPQISDNLVRLAEALSKYSRSAQTASKSTSLFSNATKFLSTSLHSVHAPTMRAHRGFTSLAAIFGRLYANFFLLIRAAHMLGNAMDYSSSMTEAQNVVNVVFGKSASVMDEFAQTAIKDFGMARLSATEFASRFQAMGSTMGLTADQIVKANDFIAGKIAGNSRAYKDLGDSVADMSINLTKLTADMASLFNQDYADVAQDMQAIYTGMTRPLRKYGLDLTQATLKEWAMANGLDADIEKMSQAEKTMLRYQYVMSRAAGAMGDFTKTQDTWANSLRTVKQLLQEVARTIGEGLINAFRPALIAFKKFLFNFLELAENALNAIGKLLGWKQIDFGGASLVEDTDDYAEALDDAAGAAKKLKGQLRGIDELNNLTTNKGGGGGAGDTGNTGADIDSLWDMIKDTEKLYESAISSWREFGSKIAEKIKEGLSSIDWESIYSTALSAGFNLAEFFNGLIDPDTWKLVGKTLAGGLRTAIKFAFSFGSDFDWENLGNAIADGLLGFFEEFDGGELADTIDVWVQGIAKVIRTAWTKLWENKDVFFADITDFLSHIDIDTVDITIKALGTVAGLTLVTAGLAHLISLTPLAIPTIGLVIGGGYLLGTTASAILDEAFGVDPATGETYFYEWWANIFDFYYKGWEENKYRFKIWNLLFGEKEQADFSGQHGERNANGRQRQYLPSLEQYKKDQASNNFWNWYNDASESPYEILVDEYKKIQKYFEDNHISFETDWYWNSDEWKQTGQEVNQFFEDTITFWKDPLQESGFNDWLDELTLKLMNLDFSSLNSLFAVITDLSSPATATGLTDLGSSFGIIGDNTSELSVNMDKLISKFSEFTSTTSKDIEDWWNNDVAPVFGFDKWVGLTETIPKALQQVWTEAVTYWTTEVPIWWDSNVAPWFTLEKWLELFKSIYTALDKTWSDATTKWKTDTTDFFEKTIKPFFTETNWSSILSGVLQAFKSIWGEARDLAKGFFNAVADFAESFINGVIDGFSALAKAKSLLSDTPFEFNIGHITIPRFANGGYPSVGSLFIAGEAGAEMVGSLNGKTAVASNGEITGIADAIRSTSSTEIELLRQQNVLLQGILEKEFGINKNDLFESVRTSAREYSGRTGKLAF